MFEGSLVDYDIVWINGKVRPYHGRASYNDVKAFINTVEGVPEPEIILCRGGKVITEDSVMPEHGSKIYCVLNLKGGGSLAASQTDFQSGTISQVLPRCTDDTPKFERVACGLNILAICDNPLCRTHEKHGGYFYAPYGYGKFSFANVSVTCVQCHTQTTQPFVTFCFVGPVTWNIRALSVDHHIQIYQTQTLDTDGDSLEYKVQTPDNPRAIVWKYLNVNVFVPLQKKVIRKNPSKFK